MRKDVAKKCHIIGMLRAQKRAHVSFHTPGHKRAGADITELSYSDNLSSPRGVIARAQEDIAQILGANKSFILTDGSTAGVLAMLYTAKSVGAKRIALSPASHKSAFNGCKLLGLTPVLLSQRFAGNIPLPPTVQELEGIAFDAFLLTSPTYYGDIASYASLRAYCEAHGALFLVDGAHGGHLHNQKNIYAGTYADLWVDGVHKSLPALTQGAVVSARTETLAEKLAQAVDIFRTTSPSYPIMASVEYAVKYPRNERLERAVSAFKNATPCAYRNADYTKLCLCLPHANAVAKALEKRGIFAEFCDGDSLCFYLSPATRMRDFYRLIKALKKVNGLQVATENVIRFVPAPPISQGETKYVPLEESVNCRVAENVGLFPPCTPLLFVGEKITQEKINVLCQADNVFGITDGKIKVFKD